MPQALAWVMPVSVTLLSWWASTGVLGGVMWSGGFEWATYCVVGGTVGCATVDTM